MDEQTRTLLDAAADEVLSASERLIFVGERLHQLIEDGDEPEAAGVEDQAEWMRAASRELDALIAEAWGPPIQGRRKKKGNIESN